MLAYLSIASGCLALLCLLVLHFVSPEYHPSWRMISEYASGKHKGWLTAFFYLWGIGSILLALLLWQEVSGIWATTGVILLILSGIGAIMGGLFDINHPKHGLAFALGVPTLPAAALLTGYHLAQLEKWSGNKSLLLWSAHATWISVVLMAVAMMVMFSGIKNSGVEWGKDAPPLEKLPDGVVALGGYANRLLVFCYIFWSISVTRIYIKL